MVSWQASGCSTHRLHPSAPKAAAGPYVRRLRGKIEDDPENPRYLRTVRGAGYRFDAIR
jgi:hypothetical protein